MDIVEKKIISIGGGGFTHQTDKFLDEFVINQIIDRKIKFGFLPTASKDNLNKIKVYYEELKKYNLELSHFELCSKVKGFSNWIMDQDIIYVGGGNTNFMLDLWQANKLYKYYCFYSLILLPLCNFKEVIIVRTVTIFLLKKLLKNCRKSQKITLKIL